MKLVTIAEMRAIEQEADANGLSYAKMMENAGYGLAEEILRGNLKPSETVEVTVADGKLVFNQLAPSAS